LVPMLRAARLQHALGSHILAREPGQKFSLPSVPEYFCTHGTPGCRDAALNDSPAKASGRSRVSWPCSHPSPLPQLSPDPAAEAGLCHRGLPSPPARSQDRAQEGCSQLRPPRGSPGIPARPSVCCCCTATSLHRDGLRRVSQQSTEVWRGLEGSRRAPGGTRGQSEHLAHQECLPRGPQGPGGLLRRLDEYQQALGHHKQPWRRAEGTDAVPQRAGGRTPGAVRCLWGLRSCRRHWGTLKASGGFRSGPVLEGIFQVVEKLSL